MADGHLNEYNSFEGRLAPAAGLRPANAPFDVPIRKKVTDGCRFSLPDFRSAVRGHACVRHNTSGVPSVTEMSLQVSAGKWPTSASAATKSDSVKREGSAILAPVHEVPD